MDPFAVDWTPAAYDDLAKLDRRTQERIRRAVYRVADTGQGDIVRLRGKDPEWRIRVGSWRVRFVFDYAAHAMRILRVLPRGSAYRD